MDNNRLNGLISQLEADDLDVLVLNPGPSLTYLTGLHLHLMERPTVLLLKPGKKPLLIVGGLEAGRVKAAGLPLEIFTYEDNPDTWHSAFKNAAEALNLKDCTIGVEPTQLRYLEIDYLQKAEPSIKIQSAVNLLSNLRLQKDGNEINKMRQAAKIAQISLQNLLPTIKIGMSEAEIASELIYQLMRAGSETPIPFPPIVASGANSANPHSTPGDRKIQYGDLLLFDWGASYQGYFSDITRTYAIGDVDNEFKRIARIVLDANQAAFHTVRPGIPAAQVDKAARDIISAEGYGKFFIHRTGHGLGMEGHETPYIHDGNQELLLQGMVFSIEPGIYLPDRGGIRIEDDVCVTENGAESLTDLPRELISIC